MKKEIENNDELLKKLALSGDALAFFALTQPYFKGRYLRVRSSGTAQQDARKMVLDEAVESLGAVQHVSFKHFNIWLEEHCSLLPVSEQAGDSGIPVDKKLLAESEEFLSHCSRELLRTGSDIKRTANLRKRKFPQALLRHRAVVGLLVVIALAAFGVGVTLVMIKTHLALQIHLLSSGKRVTFQFPPEVWLLHDSPVANSVIPPVTVIDSTGKGDTLHVAVQKNTPPDTLLQKVQPSEKVSDPVAQGAVPQRRSLPPVVPKARLILPPAPPVPVDQVTPSYQEATPYGQQPAPTPSDPSPSSEPESSY